MIKKDFHIYTHFINISVYLHGINNLISTNLKIVSTYIKVFFTRNSEFAFLKLPFLAITLTFYFHFLSLEIKCKNENSILFVINIIYFSKYILLLYCIIFFLCLVRLLEFKFCFWSYWHNLRNKQLTFFSYKLKNIKSFSQINKNLNILNFDL